jgi:predicted dehydrogenase
VDDDATIILKYDTANAIIQASWNWPIGRKDMEVYGETGVIFADDRNALRLRLSEGYDGFTEESMELEERKPPYDDPFSLFAAVIKNELTLSAYDPYSLENNMIVMEILEAARKSAMAGRTVQLRN